MYWTLVHGWGTDPSKHVSVDYYKKATAKKAMLYLFDIYQKQLEDHKAPAGLFTCIIKAKGVENNGLN